MPDNNKLVIDTDELIGKGSLNENTFCIDLYNGDTTFTATYPPYAKLHEQADAEIKQLEDDYSKKYDELNARDKQLDAKDKQLDREADDLNEQAAALTKEQARLSQQPQNSQQGGQFSTANKDHTKAVERHKKDQAQYNKDRKQYNKEAKELKKKRQEIDQKQADRKQADEKFKDDHKSLKWVWSAFPGRPSFTAANGNQAITDGSMTVSPLFSKVFEGNGLAWIEPFMPAPEGNNAGAPASNSTSERTAGPTNKAPNGYFVRASGEPKILSVAWRTYSSEKDGTIIGSGIEYKFGQSVQLHIYTQGLYGNDIEIQLVDHDKMDPDDDLTINPYDASGKPIPANASAPIDANVPKAQFRREVKTHHKLSDESSSDTTKLVTSDAKQDGSTLHLVQKVVIDVFLDPLWKAPTKKGGDNAGDSLAVYAKVRHSGSEEFAKFKSDYLIVEGDKPKKEYSVLATTGNTPVLVGDSNINTDPADFHPCKYDRIDVVIESTFEPKSRAVVLYGGQNNEGEDQLANADYIGIVTGTREFGKTLKFTVTKPETADCRNEGFANDHTGKVININGVRTVVSGPMLSNPTQPSIATFPDMFGHPASTDPPPGQNTQDFKVIAAGTQTDNKLELKVSYPYPYTTYEEEDLQLWKYLLPAINRQDMPVLTIPFLSCRLERTAHIRLYPDIKWIVKVVFNREIKRVHDMVVHWAVGVSEYATIAIPFPEGWMVYHRERHVQVSGQFPVPQFEIEKPKIEVAITAQLNRKDDEKYDKEVKFMETIKKRIDGEKKRLGTLLKLVEAILAGDERGETNPRAPRPGGVNIAEKLKKNSWKIGQRKPLSFKVTAPSLAFAVSWEAIEGNNDAARNQHKDTQVGYLLHGSVEAAPLLGIEITVDFLALIQKAHPIARGVVEVLDAVGAVLNTAITLNFKVTGTLEMTIASFFFNTITGENTFNSRALSDNNEKPSSVTGKIVAELEASITGETGFAVCGFSVGFSVDVKAKAEAAFWAEFALMYSDGKSSNAKLAGKEGFYIQPLYVFDGIEFKYKTKMDVELNKEGNVPNRPNQNQTDNNPEHSRTLRDKIKKKGEPIFLQSK